MAGVSSAAAAGTPRERLFSTLSELRAAYDVNLCKFKVAGPELLELVNRDIGDISDDIQNDERLLKLMIIRADVNGNFAETFKKLEEQKICEKRALFYECYAMYHISEGNLLQADKLYNEGIKRNAVPLEYLKHSYAMFLKHVGRIAQPKRLIEPYSPKLIKHLLGKIDKVGKSRAGILQKVTLNSQIMLGGDSYNIKEILGVGQHAYVFKAYKDNDPNSPVALKVEKNGPVLGSWEFYMYNQLSYRIHSIKRSKFGAARGLYTYRDTSILDCEYLPNGTLQDAINFYTLRKRTMEEVTCIYYTIEMLDMLEILHGVGIIHGDFNPENLLLMYASSELKEEGFKDRTGPWSDMGLCLIDWGKGIDVNIFPYSTEFTGYCETVGFRCIEMQEDRSWKYQIDSYGLCRVVYLMIHGESMDGAIEKKLDPDGVYRYRPRATFKKGWNAGLWENLFLKLLNTKSSRNDQMLLRNLKNSFEDYICSNPTLITRLAFLLAWDQAFVAPHFQERLRKEKASLMLNLTERYQGIPTKIVKNTYRDVIADFEKNIFKVLEEAYPQEIFIMPVEEAVFGRSLELRITLEDIKSAVNYEELTLVAIKIYLVYLYHKIKSKYPDKAFQFTSFHGCSLRAPVTDAHIDISSYLRSAVPGSFTFFIFNPGNHWFILACKDANFYYIDSQDTGFINVEMMILVTKAVNHLNESGTQLEPNWIKLKCPIQPDSKCCGHYVLRNLSVILDTASNDPLERIREGQRYPKDVLDQVRAELLDFVKPYIVSHISKLREEQVHFDADHISAL